MSVNFVDKQFDLENWDLGDCNYKSIFRPNKSLCYIYIYSQEIQKASLLNHLLKKLNKYLLLIASS